MNDERLGKLNQAAYHLAQAREQLDFVEAKDARIIIDDLLGDIAEAYEALTNE